MTYDPNNIFAKILSGEMPAHKVYEDDDALVIMDVMPQSEGHALIIPKTPSRNLLDADPAVLARLMPLAQRVARAAKEAFAAHGVTVVQFNEEAAGQTVFHLHFHVVPRFAEVALKAHGGPMEKPELLAANAEKLRRVMASA